MFSGLPNDDFEREDRYLVLKRKDLGVMLEYFGKEDTEKFMLMVECVASHRAIKGKPPLRCVVVEDDWPEYETVWKMIEERMKDT